MRSSNTHQHRTAALGARIEFFRCQFVQRERQKGGRIAHGHLHRVVGERRRSVVGQRAQLGKVQRCVGVHEANVGGVVEHGMVKLVGLCVGLGGRVQRNDGECGVLSQERLSRGGREIFGLQIECVDLEGEISIVFVKQSDEFGLLKVW